MNEIWRSLLVRNSAASANIIKSATPFLYLVRIKHRHCMHHSRLLIMYIEYIILQQMADPKVTVDNSKGGKCRSTWRTRTSGRQAFPLMKLEKERHHDWNCLEIDEKLRAI